MSKAEENRLRRVAQRRGLRLEKSRRRDPNALDYGQWWVMDESTRGLVFGGQWGASLEDVRDYLEGQGH